MDQSGVHKKMNEFFFFFSIFNFRNVTVRVEKVDEKNRIICLVSMFLSWVTVLKLSEKVSMLQFCDDLGKKSTSIKTI